MTNPPTLIFTDALGISMCKGCGKKITPNSRHQPEIWYSAEEAKQDF